MGLSPPQTPHMAQPPGRVQGVPHHPHQPHRCCCLPLGEVLVDVRSSTARHEAEPPLPPAACPTPRVVCSDTRHVQPHVRSALPSVNHPFCRLPASDLAAESLLDATR